LNGEGSGANTCASSILKSEEDTHTCSFSDKPCEGTACNILVSFDGSGAAITTRNDEDGVGSGSSRESYLMVCAREHRFRGVDGLRKGSSDEGRDDECEFHVGRVE